MSSGGGVGGRNNACGRVAESKSGEGMTVEVELAVLIDREEGRSGERRGKGGEAGISKPGGGLAMPMRWERGESAHARSLADTIVDGTE
jgi:hypothetical protein